MIRRRHAGKSCIILLITFCLSSCGFHLRGMTHAPTWLTSVAIVLQQGHHDLTQRLSEQLKGMSIPVYSDTSKAKYWIIIDHDEFQQAISSISSSTTPRQYQLTYRIAFTLQSNDGKELIPMSVIVVNRQLTLNSDRLLGSNHEDDLIQGEMRQEAVMRIVNRLSRQQ